MFELDKLFAEAVPIVAIVGAFAFLIVGILSRLQERKLVYQERMKSIEKGITLPPLPVEHDRSNPIRTGLIWMAIGVGFFISLLVASNEPAAAIWGIIPFLIGVVIVIAPRKRAPQA